MDATYQHVVHTETSFSYETYDLDRFPFLWHFHPEYELTLITSGRGRRHVGDHIDDYAPGDLVLVGPDLPHSWRSNPTAGPAERSAAVVIRFRRSFLGDEFTARPELQAVCALLDRSARGLAFAPTAAPRVRERLPRMRELDSFGRLLELIAVLGELAGSVDDALELASVGYRPALREVARRRMDDVCAYIDEHHGRPLTLREVAGIAHMAPSAFSRAFHRVSKRTFTAYLNEVRIGAASRLLVETELPVAVIAADCGFRSLANFNRRFRALRGTTPRDYRRTFTDDDRRSGLKTA